MASGVDMDPLRSRVSFLVLTLLALKPSHGYELIKSIEKLTMGMIKPGPGTMYPLLRTLKEEGLVSEEVVSEGGRTRRVYRLTEKGWQALAAQLEVFKVVTLNILDLVEAASRAVRSRGGGCPPADLAERLERLASAVAFYVKVVRERLESCRRGGGHGGEG